MGAEEGVVSRCQTNLLADGFRLVSVALLDMKCFVNEWAICG